MNNEVFDDKICNDKGVKQQTIIHRCTSHQNRYKKNSRLIYIGNLSTQINFSITIATTKERVKVTVYKLYSRGRENATAHLPRCEQKQNIYRLSFKRMTTFAISPKNTNKTHQQKRSVTGELKTFG